MWYVTIFTGLYGKEDTYHLGTLFCVCGAWGMWSMGMLMGGLNKLAVKRRKETLNDALVFEFH